MELSSALAAFFSNALSASFGKYTRDAFGLTEDIELAMVEYSSARSSMAFLLGEGDREEELVDRSDIAECEVFGLAIDGRLVGRPLSYGGDEISTVFLRGEGCFGSDFPSILDIHPDMEDLVFLAFCAFAAFSRAFSSFLLLPSLLFCRERDTGTARGSIATSPVKYSSGSYGPCSRPESEV